MKCECDNKNNEILINKAESFSSKSIYQSFYDALKYSNYKVLKCSKLAISFNSISPKNMGSIITLAFFIFNFIFFIIYAVKGIKILKVDFSKIIGQNLGNDIFNKNEDITAVNHGKKNKKRKTYKSTSKKYEKSKYKENKIINIVICLIIILLKRKYTLI